MAISFAATIESKSKIISFLWLNQLVKLINFISGTQELEIKINQTIQQQFLQILIEKHTVS
ncbi:hypothetical protein H6G75_20440 [Nostoc sp. FACHB-280]|nr:hypothetical protein [Nostoc sp. FACHB-280]